MEFQSDELQKSFKSAKPILEKITETKNKVSNEIKKLENFLKSLNLDEPFTYLVKNPNNLSSIVCDQFFENCGTGNGIATEENLIWDNKSKRLIFHATEYQACIDIGAISSVEIDSDTANTIIERPLIETPFDIRKRIYEGHLSKFLSALAKKFTIIEKKIDEPF